MLILLLSHGLPWVFIYPPKRMQFSIEKCNMIDRGTGTTVSLTANWTMITMETGSWGLVFIQMIERDAFKTKHYFAVIGRV